MKKIIKNILAYFGIAIVKTAYLKNKPSTQNEEKPNYENKNILIHNGFNLLKKKGFIPHHIMDVGANHGTWTREVMTVFPDANYTLIEPQKWLSESFNDLLQLSNFNFLPIGVGKDKGEFMFTIVDRDDSCSFRVSEKEAIEQGYKQIPIPVNTINEIVKTERFGIPDLLKIDAEGLDLEVLDGATNILGKTEVILLEASVVNPVFTNDLQTVVNYMNNKGYKLFDITDLNRPFENKVLWLVELMFIKKEGKFDSINWLN